MTTCLPGRAESLPGHVDRRGRAARAPQRSLVDLAESVLFLNQPVPLTDRLVALLIPCTTALAGLVVVMTVVALLLRLAQHAAAVHGLLG